MSMAACMPDMTFAAPNGYCRFSAVLHLGGAANASLNLPTEMEGVLLQRMPDDFSPPVRSGVGNELWTVTASGLSRIEPRGRTWVIAGGPPSRHLVREIGGCRTALVGLFLPSWKERDVVYRLGELMRTAKALKDVDGCTRVFCVVKASADVLPSEKDICDLIKKSGEVDQWFVMVQSDKPRANRLKCVLNKLNMGVLVSFNERDGGSFQRIAYESDGRVCVDSRLSSNTKTQIKWNLI